MHRGKPGSQRFLKGSGSVGRNTSVIKGEKNRAKELFWENIKVTDPTDFCHISDCFLGRAIWRRELG